MVRAARASMHGADLATLDEAAATLGASRTQRFLQIVVPNAAPGIVTGALTVLTLSIGEFNLTWLLHTPLTKTLPVRSEEHTSELQSLMRISYAVVCLTQKTHTTSTCNSTTD